MSGVFDVLFGGQSRDVGGRSSSISAIRFLILEAEEWKCSL